MEKEEPSTQQPSLPAELLCEIISLCKPASLLNLCLANTVFRDIASPSLYKRLSFSSPTQAEAFVHAVSSSLSLFISPSFPSQNSYNDRPTETDGLVAELATSLFTLTC
jgi:hypothetical protein